jgi:hypothetical protein
MQMEGYQRGDWIETTTEEYRCLNDDEKMDYCNWRKQLWLWSLYYHQEKKNVCVYSAEPREVDLRLS